MDTIHSQQQQQQRQPQIQQGFQSNFNCYEAFPVTSPPEQQFFNPNQQNFGQPSGQQAMEEISYMAVPSDPNHPGSQTGQPGYYYYTPQTNQQNVNINPNFGFQNAMRPMPNHPMMGLPVSSTNV
uniref:Uncharacterized protein n=2 Tax=Panagrolaimus sp. JU765 TaxID=591449 RepID=A0AC34PXE8_9BILA